MKIPRGTRSDIGFPTTSARVVDDPDNYAKEFPVRGTRNPKPQYKMPLEPLPLPKWGKPKSSGRGGTPKKVLTPRRKGIMIRFIMECSSNPNKYGRIGSIPWMDELANQINTPATGRGLGTMKGPVSHSDVQIWLDHADIVDRYENLQRKQRLQSEPAQPVAGTSGGVAKDKSHAAPLPPKKRVRISPPSTWEFISPPTSPSSSCPALLASQKDPLSIDDRDTRSSRTSTPSSSASGGHPVPAQSSSSSCYTSSLNTTGETQENSTVRVTVIKKNLLDEALLQEAAAVAEELAASSMVDQTGEDVELPDELLNVITEPAKKEEFILPSDGNAQGGQHNMNQDQPLGLYHQDEGPSNPEGQVVSFESIDFQALRDPQPFFSMQGMNPVALTQHIPLGAVTYNDVVPIAVGRKVQAQSVHFSCAIPTPSPDIPSYGALNLIQNRGQIPLQSGSNYVTYEERRLDPLHGALGNLHNSINSVREAYNGLDALNYQSRAPTAMRIFGYIVDTLISFYANYMNPRADGQ